MEEQRKIKKPRVRSPNYPIFSLGEAIQKTTILWDEIGKTASHRSVVIEHLGYTSEHGNSRRALSALKIYGLISENNSQINLTDKAVNVIFYPPNDPNYISTLKELALSPKIFNDLYEFHDGSFPVDKILKAELITEFKFNQRSVDHFISTFRETMEYAGLNKKDEEITNGNFDSHKSERIKENNKMPNSPHHSTTTSMVTRGTGGQSFPLPLMDGNKITVTFDKLPVSKKELNKLKGWIDLFEDTLTEENEINEERPG